MTRTEKCKANITQKFDACACGDTTRHIVVSSCQNHHHHHHHHHHQVPVLFKVTLFIEGGQLLRAPAGGWRHILPPSKGATPALVVATRAAEGHVRSSRRRWSARRTTACGHRTLHLRGTRPEQLPVAPGPQAAVTVGYVAAGAPSLVLALVAVHDGLDDATAQVLLQQSLRARAAEEEEAKEVAEVKELEDVVVMRERWVASTAWCARWLMALRATSPSSSTPPSPGSSPRSRS